MRFVVGVAVVLSLGCGGVTGADDARRREELAAQEARVREELTLREAQEAQARLDAEAARALAEEERVRLAAEEARAGVTAPSLEPVEAWSDWEGSIARASDGLVVVKGAGNPPPKGARAELSKQIDQKLGNISLTAWLVIADVVVESSSGGEATLRVVEERADTVINGKKHDHFTQGSTVKLAPP